MSKAIFYCTFKLKKNINPADFIQTAKSLNDNYISKQPGYIGWQQLRSGDTWADSITFETLDDAKNFEKNANANPNDLALAFYSFINLPSCKVQYFSVEAEYGHDK
jgi:hypothetical protein